MAIKNYRNKTIGELNMKDGLAQDQETRQKLFCLKNDLPYEPPKKRRGRPPKSKKEENG